MHGEPHKKCLVLTANVSIGYQTASLLEQHGWHTHVVHSDQEVYDRILTDDIDAVVAEIDVSNLGGLAVLAFCHQHHPAIATYAITHPDDEYGKKMARDTGGCQGYFYLEIGRLQIDAGRGMAAELTTPD